MDEVMRLSLDTIYEAEPELRAIAESATRYRRRGRGVRLSAYEDAKREARPLVGWYARNPRLKNSAAWDCFFRHIIRALRI